MPQRPFEYLTDYMKGKVERTGKLVEYVHTQADSLITWLIGFSFTGLLLIVANFNTLKTKEPTKAIIICLFICIVLGIAFRYVSYLITMFHKGLEDYFYGLFHTDLMTPIILNEDIEKMNHAELILLLKSDFNEIITYPFELTDDFKKQEEPRLREHYLALIEHSKKEYEIGINHLADIDETAYRFKKEKTLAKLLNIQEMMKQSKIGYDHKFWSRLRGILYTLCLLTFLIAVFILCISLLLTLPNNN